MTKRRFSGWSLFLGGVALAAAFAVISTAGAQQSDGPRWWKGNTHTHSLWSDGDDYPEMIALRYRQRGYNFLALSDHNVLSEGTRWLDTSSGRGAGAVLEAYRTAFGRNWVETRMVDGKQQVRLKPLREFAPLLEAPGKFLMIQSEEISASYQRRPIHLNATNIHTLIPPQTGTSVSDVIQKNVDAVLAQREATGQPMFPHLNHPNFGWAVTLEDLMQVRGERFFEVYNGHPSVHNYGQDGRPGTERMWDVILSCHLADGLEPLFGLAVDDAHRYHTDAQNQSIPFRGWIMVRADHLTPESIVRAMEAGDFYSTTGVTLRDLTYSNNRLRLEIEPAPGVTYKTHFIGTRRGFDRTSTEAPTDKISPNPASRVYSSEIGQVLSTSTSLTPQYIMKGDELYVRARAESSREHPAPYKRGDLETAWSQPVRPGQQ